MPRNLGRPHEVDGATIARWRECPGFWLIVLFACVAGLTNAHPMVTEWQINHDLSQMLKLIASDSVDELDPSCPQVMSSSPFLILPDIMSLQQPTDARSLTHAGRALWTEGHCDKAITFWRLAVTEGTAGAAVELMRRNEDLAELGDAAALVAEYAYQRGVADKQPVNAQSRRWLERSMAVLPSRKAIYALTTLPEYRSIAARRLLWQEMTDRLPAGDGEYWWAKAEIQQLDEDWNAAALSYDIGASLSSNPHGFLMREGEAWLRAGDLDRATLSYEKARTTQPEDASAYIGLGTVYRIRREYQEALRWFESAGGLDSANQSDIYYRVGETYLASGDRGKARSNLEEAIRLEKNNAYALRLLAELAFSDGKTSEAEVQLLQAIQSIRDDSLRGDWLILLGDWRLGGKDCNGATEAYEQAGEVSVSRDLVERKINSVSATCGP